MRRVKKACVSSSAIPSWWSTQPSRVTLMLKVKSPMVSSVRDTRRSTHPPICHGITLPFNTRYRLHFRTNQSYRGEVLGLVAALIAVGAPEQVGRVAMSTKKKTDHESIIRDGSQPRTPSTRRSTSRSTPTTPCWTTPRWQDRRDLRRHFPWRQDLVRACRSRGAAMTCERRHRVSPLPRSRPDACGRSCGRRRGPSA